MFDDPQKIKGVIVSLFIHGLLAVLFIYVGMTYQDPPPEPGVAIVFGFDEQGQGQITLPPEPSQESAESSEQEEVKEVVEDVPEEVVETDDDKLMTSEEEAPVVAKEKPKLTKEEKEKIQKEKEAAEKKRQEEAEKERIRKEEEKKKNKLDNMFSNFDKNSDGDANQGDDDKPGFKGDVDGSKDATSFSGGPVGGDGDYSLGNRKPTNTPKPIYDGQEEGIVVVRIIVDQNGKVLEAFGGQKGSTTTNLQLIKRAQEAALKTRWAADPTAPSRQTGKITYRFQIEN
jgi:outer membrane biosynthesis protein TonB